MAILRTTWGQLYLTGVGFGVSSGPVVTVMRAQLVTSTRVVLATSEGNYPEGQGGNCGRDLSLVVYSVLLLLL